MNIAIVTWQRWNGRKPGSVGSSIIRGDWVVAADPDFQFWKHGVPFDALILQKVYNKDFLTDFNGVKILDLCDPDWLGGGVDIAEYMNRASAVTCSSEGLANAVRGYTDRPVHYVPDRINYEYLPKPKPVSDDRAKTVVWFGYAQNSADTLNIVLETLKEYNLNLLVVSNEAYEPMKDRGVQIKNVKWEPTTAYQEIQRGDIVLNYQPPFGKYAYKSSNKTNIAYALGLPVAHSAEDLERLIAPDARKSAIEAWNANERDKHDIRHTCRQYKEIIESVK